MRLKQSKARGQKAAPAPISPRRKSRRRSDYGMRSRQPPVLPIGKSTGSRLDIGQWLTAVAIALISLALIFLIWTLTARAIEDEAVEIRTRVEQQVRSVAAVAARAIQHEMAVVDQSLAIVQDAWKKDSDSVDLAELRKQTSALTAVADDIFIANERRVIVQGTIPLSIGQGFGSAYVTYSNGSLEKFDTDGSKMAEGRTSAGSVTGNGVEARQFLMYVLRPLDRPRGWFTGASYRSEEITKLFAAANLGQDGIVGMVETRNGRVQAIVGRAARLAEVSLANSELIDVVKKNEAGIWAGVAPIDQVRRIIAYARVPGRDMAIMVGVNSELAMFPVEGLANWARGLAVVGSLIVLTVAGLVLWSILTAQGAKRRQRNLERAEISLTHARREIEIARARTLLTEAEVGTLITSQTDGVARLDDASRLRQWNLRFVEFAGVPLDETSLGLPVEALFRRQAQAGLFGDQDDPNQEVSRRLTVLHGGGEAVEWPLQLTSRGYQVTMLVRGVSGGGHVIILASPETLRYAAMPALPPARAPETVGEATDW